MLSFFAYVMVLLEQARISQLQGNSILFNCFREQPYKMILGCENCTEEVIIMFYSGRHFQKIFLGMISLWHWYGVIAFQVTFIWLCRCILAFIWLFYLPPAVETMELSPIRESLIIILIFK